MSGYLPISATPLFPRDSIKSAPPGSDHYFSKGPFEELSGENFCDPFFEHRADSAEPMIISSAGRILQGVGDGEILDREIFAIAAKGGWDEEVEGWEIHNGGGDVIAEHVTARIAEGLLNMLGATTGAFSVEGRVVPREAVWRAYVVFRGGATFIPW